MKSAEVKPPSKSQGIPTPRPRARRTQEERRDTSEQKILQAALELVAEKGSIRVTLAEIGERAGYSRGLPAHRFGNKNKLLAALAKLINDRFAEHRNSFPAEPGLPTLEATIRAYFTRSDPNLTTTRALIVMMAESALEPTELQESMAQYNRLSLRNLRHHIGLAQELGQVRQDLNPDTLAMVILASMRGVMLQRLNDPSIALDKVRDEILSMVLQHCTISNKATPAKPKK